METLVLWISPLSRLQCPLCKTDSQSEVIKLGVQPMREQIIADQAIK